jgi:hypothetical protein
MLDVLAHSCRHAKSAAAEINSNEYHVRPFEWLLVLSGLPVRERGERRVMTRLTAVNSWMTGRIDPRDYKSAAYIGLSYRGWLALLEECSRCSPTQSGKNPSVTEIL